MYIEIIYTSGNVEILNYQTDPFRITWDSVAGKLEIYSFDAYVGDFTSGDEEVAYLDIGRGNSQATRLERSTASKPQPQPETQSA